MSCVVHRQPGAESGAAEVTLRVVGDIDMDTAPEITAAVAELDLATVDEVVIDLSGVGFLDSSGLGALVGAHKATGEASSRLVVVCSNPQLLTLFEITRLCDVLTIVPEHV